MFIKTLKYDFQFSKAAFLAMAGVLVVLAFIVRVTGLFNEYGLTVSGMVGVIFSIVIMIIGVASVIQILQFYYKNFFDDTGYLMLTLPVKRFGLLISKVAVSFVWVNFMLLTGAIMVLIFTFTRETNLWNLISNIGLRHIMIWVEMNIAALFFVTALFFAVTLANSVVGRWRINNIIAAAVGLLYIGLFFWLHVVIGGRHMEQVTNYHEFGTLSFYQAVVGINVGRIPIGDMGDYFDIYSWGTSLALCIFAFCMTYYLLKRRASLK